MRSAVFQRNTFYFVLRYSRLTNNTVIISGETLEFKRLTSQGFKGRSHGFSSKDNKAGLLLFLPCNAWDQKQLTFTQVTDGTQRETGLLAGEESSASVYLSVYHLPISKYSLSTYLSIICPVYLAQALWNDEL